MNPPSALERTEADRRTDLISHDARARVLAQLPRDLLVGNRSACLPVRALPTDAADVVTATDDSRA